ncbi:hypothetical protein MY5147_008912 [Beauveria neobassiana]
MPCCAPGVSSADITSADELQRAAIQQIQLEKMKQLREALRDIEIPPSYYWFRIAELSGFIKASSAYRGEHQTYGIATSYIREATGLYLPMRDFCRDPWSWDAYHTSYGKWVQFAPVASELPHAVCLVVDSGTPEDDMILLSEAEQAAALVEFQLKDSGYINHHTKPVLVATIMRNQTARLTQAYFDGKQNMLVLRQSRTLDLSGRLPSPDAWLLLRWIASQPIGETRYPENAAKEELLRDDPTNLTSQILV